MNQKSCGICEALFTPRNNNQRYCKIECSNMARMKNKQIGPKMKPCSNCGKDFLTSIKFKNYCSKACRDIGDEVTYQRIRAAVKAKQQKVHEAKNCIVCKKEFRPKSKEHICCSDGCRAQRARVYQERKNAKMRKPEIKKKCLYCEVIFTAYTSNNHYCSKSCRKALSRAKAKAFRSSTSNAEVDKRIEQKRAQTAFASPPMPMDADPIAEADPLMNRSSRSHFETSQIDQSAQIESSEFSEEIKRYLKRGGKIQKLGVTFAFNQISVEGSQESISYGGGNILIESNQ